MRRTILASDAGPAAVVGLPGVASADEDLTHVVPSDVTRIESPAPCPGPEVAPFCGWERDGARWRSVPASASGGRPPSRGSA